MNVIMLLFGHKDKKEKFVLPIICFGYTLPLL